MAIIYSNDDPVSGRWSGVNRLLTAYEVNYNFYQHETRIATLEANYTLTVSLASISQPTASSLLFTLTDASTQGPFEMPVATFRDRGAWTTNTAYLVNDTFTANGALYRVLFDHTSDPTSFSPTANDGAGHDYYAAMLSSPGNALPAGGATGAVLQKSSGTDFAVSWGYKLPTGGTANQVLLKRSSTNQDADWETLSASIVEFSPSTSSGLTSTNVADALEELEGLMGTTGGHLSDLSDVQFATGDPGTGALLWYGGAAWEATAPISAGEYLTWDGSAFVGGPGSSSSMATLTDATITSPEDGDTLVYDSSSGKWINRPGYLFIGTTSSNLTFGGSSPDYSSVRITPTANLQIIDGGVKPGERVTVIINTSGGTSYNITAGAGVYMSGTLATGTASGKLWTLNFICDSGVGLIETGRSGPF